MGEFRMLTFKEVLENDKKSFTCWDCNETLPPIEKEIAICMQG